MRRVWVIGLIAALSCALCRPVTAHAGVFGCSVPTVNDRCETWASIYDDPTIAQGSDQLEPRIAVSPDRSRVFIAAIDEALNSGDPYNSPAKWVVLAYDGHTGAQVWSSTYQSSGNYDRPNAIAISPDGRFVYVTGASYDAPVLISTSRNLVTIAYDATTGAQLWLTRNPNTADRDTGTAIVVSPDGSQVYATADIEASGGEIDWAAVAYRAADGLQLWRTRYNGVASGTVNAPAGMAISNDGALVYITGESGSTVQYDSDYATVAYATGGATPGAQVWLSRYDGVGQHYPDRSAGIAVDAGGRVVVTGDSISNFTTNVADDFATVAYDGATGQQLWASRYSGPSGGVNFGMAVAASRTDHSAVVTGQIEPSGRSGDTAWATLGYDSATGQQLWTQVLNTTGYSSQSPQALAVTPDGSTAVVTGFSGGRVATPVTSPLPGSEGVTIAYRVGDGAQQWVARYSGSVTDGNTPRGVAVSDDGSVFVTEQVGHDLSTDTSGANNHYDAATLAYLAAPPTSVPESPAAWWLLGAAAAVVPASLWRTRRRARKRGPGELIELD